MKANVNYNLEGDEEPGVFGTGTAMAQNVKFTFRWARSQIFGSNCHPSKRESLLQVRVYHIDTPEAPQEINSGNLQLHHAS